MVMAAGAGAYGDRRATVDELLERWMAHARLGPNTRAGYTGVIRKYLSPAFGQKQVYRITTADLDAYYDALERHGMKPARIYKLHTVMRSAPRQALRWGWIVANPAVQASPPPVPRTRIRPPSVEAAEAVLAAAEKFDRACCAGRTCTPCRPRWRRAVHQRPRDDVPGVAGAARQGLQDRTRRRRR